MNRKIKVQRFWLQPTPSFPDAPQREEYEDDNSFRVAGLKYEEEWRAKYICGDAACKNRDCPQHFPCAIAKLPDSAFKPNHGAESNHVFLWEACDVPPFMRAVPGWKIVGYGKAPWPGSTDGFAVMFERVLPASSEYGNVRGDKCAEGTRIWQHSREAWVPGQADYERRMSRAVKK